MVVSLVIPPSAFLLDERVFTSLGILKIAAVLEQAGVATEVLDLAGVSNYEEAVAQYCQSARARSPVFGITATTPQMPASMNILKTIRKEAPQAKVIIGGPHATLVNAACRHSARAKLALEKLLAQYDVVVAGDGEKAIFPALQLAAGLVDADDPRSPLWLTSRDFTESPWPARHLIDLDSYHYSIDGERATHLIAQLGCPFECGFCGGRESAMLRRIRTRSTDNVIKEVEYLHDTYGARGFMLYDDELNVNKDLPNLMRGLTRLAQQKHAEFRFRGFVKAELFTEEQAQVMHEAGFRWLLIGFESGAEKILSNINKKATREDNTRAVEIAHTHGLKVKALMSMGHPGESAETVRATADWLLEVKPDDFDLSIITVYPGTPYYDRAVPSASQPGVYIYEINGNRLYSYDNDLTEVAEYYKGVPGEYRAFTFTDHLSPEDLVKLRDEIESEVRGKLGIPFNPSASARRFEHSMGMGLPDFILKNAPSRVASKG